MDPFEYEQVVLDLPGLDVAQTEGLKALSQPEHGGAGVLDAICANPYGHRDLGRALVEVLCMNDSGPAERLMRMRKTVEQYVILNWIDHLFETFARIGVNGTRAGTKARKRAA